MQYLQYEKTGHVGRLTINRPDKLNALESGVLEELGALLGEIEQDQEVRCLILTGAGEKAFVAGADIIQMSDFSPEEAKAFSRLGNRVFLAIERFAVPVIAAVNGYALGGGCELAISCDIRLASERAAFAQPEVGLGIPPGFGGTQRLRHIVGEAKAKELIYTGRRIKADEALSIGLVNAVYPAEGLMDEAVKLAETIAGNVPFAVRSAKRAINEGRDLDIEAGVEREAELFSRCFTTEDRAQAMGAFVRREPPGPFHNR